MLKVVERYEFKGRFKFNLTNKYEFFNKDDWSHLQNIIFTLPFDTTKQAIKEYFTWLVQRSKNIKKHGWYKDLKILKNMVGTKI